MKNDVYVLQKNLFGAKIGDEVHFILGSFYSLKLNNNKSISLDSDIVENNPEYFILKDESAHYKEIDLYHCFVNASKFNSFQDYLSNMRRTGNPYETKKGVELKLICNENDFEITAFIALKELQIDNKVCTGFIKKEDGFYYSGDNKLSFTFLSDNKDYSIFSVKRLSDNKVFGIDASDIKEGFILGVDRLNGRPKRVNYNNMGRHLKEWQKTLKLIKLIDGKIFQEDFNY